MKYLASIYPGQLFTYNGKVYMKNRDEFNMTEAYCLTDQRLTCFWIWTKVTIKD